MTYETLAVDIEDGIGTVLLNRPEKLNAYTPRIGQELPLAFAALDGDREWMLSGKTYEVEELARGGLINHVLAAEHLLPQDRDLAREMASCAPLSLKLTRQALYQGLHETFEAQVRYEAFALDHLYRSRDHAEAVAARREKRKPNFEGR